MTMQAVVLDRHGDADVLRLAEVARPVPGPGQVLLRLRSAGVNHVDIDIRAGVSGMSVPLPHIPGVDGAGEIAALGAGVTGFAAGDRVMPHFVLACGHCRQCLAGHENICEDFGILGATCPGTYAQYVCVGAHHLMRIPAGVDDVAAAAGFVPFATAWEALVEAGAITAGQTVLVNAGGSGVSSAGIQVAALAGARVITTAGSADKLARAAALGADAGINYREADITATVLGLTDGRGVDLVLDMVGGEVLKQSIAAVAAGGRVVSVGAHAGEVVDIDMIQLFRKHVSVHGCGRSTRATGEHVLRLMAAGRLRPVLARTLPLAEAGEAHRLLEARALFGRVVLAIP